MISWFVFLTALHCLALVYLLYKVILLATADADLTLYTKKMKPSYFDQKVVWVTGASSGSELIYSMAVIKCYNGMVNHMLSVVMTGTRGTLI